MIKIIEPNHVEGIFINLFNLFKNLLGEDYECRDEI